MFQKRQPLLLTVYYKQKVLQLLYTKIDATDWNGNQIVFYQYIVLWIRENNPPYDLFFNQSSNDIKCTFRGKDNEKHDSNSETFQIFSNRHTSTSFHSNKLEGITFNDLFFLTTQRTSSPQVP